jgi:hypothetical protein
MMSSERVWLTSDVNDRFVPKEYQKFAARLAD